MRDLGNRSSIVKIVLILIFGISSIYGDSVKARVSITTLIAGNSVNLEIKAIGENIVFPRISAVAGNVITSSSQSSSSSFTFGMNGKTYETSTTKNIVFIPKKDLTIPSYRVKIDGKEYNTTPIDIKVIKTKTAKKEGTALFLLELNTTKTKVTIGESFMITLYFSLKNGVRLSQNIQYTPPGFAGFLVKEGSKPREYQKDKYQIQELKYILTAISEGNFTIKPAEAKIGVQDRMRKDMFGMMFGTQWKETISNIIKIEVTPQSEDSDMIGDYKVETTVDNQRVKPNKPVNLTIRIEGKGNLEIFEFPKYEIDGVTIYTNDAKIETTVVDDEIESSYTKSFAFISDIDFTIPKVELTMLTTKGELKELNIDSFDIKIEGVAKTSITKPKGVVETGIIVPIAPIKPKEIIVEKIVEKIVEVQVNGVEWWMLIVSFLLGTSVIIIWNKIPTLRRKNIYSEEEALKLLYSKMGEDEKVEEMVNRLYIRKNGDKTIKIDKKELRDMVDKFR
ncbi:MAG: BatD family protein [Sulfurovum sp.]